MSEQEPGPGETKLDQIITNRFGEKPAELTPEELESRMRKLADKVEREESDPSPERTDDDEIAEETRMKDEKGARKDET